MSATTCVVAERPLVLKAPDSVASIRKEPSVQLFRHVLAGLLVAGLGSAQGTNAAGVARVHHVGAAEVLNLEFAVFDVVDSLADNSPDAGAEVREVGAEVQTVHRVDAVGEGRQR